MIRPFTCICALLALGSGLYLYQTKHHAQVVDRQIERTVQAITATRMQTRELAAAWTLLGNPDRLQALANQYLDIKPVQPSQFVALADLDSRLPPPRALPPPPTPEDNGSVPIASASPATPAGGADPLASAAAPSSGGPSSAGSAGRPRAVATANLPAAVPAQAASPSPAPPSIVQSARAPGVVSSPASANDAAKAAAVVASRPVEHKPAEAPRPPREEAQARPIPLHPAASPPVVAELERPVTPALQRLSPAPLTGSLLGMAHTAVPPPVPLPISTAPFSGRNN